MKISNDKCTEATKPQVFIIESLPFEDEENDRHEGDRIRHLLSLSGKDCQYFYIRTRAELAEVLERFWDSGFRYLHLACHANWHEMETTIDRIPFEDLTGMLRPYLYKRRLFLSACRMGSHRFANQLLAGSESYSVLGHSAKVDMADTAMFWAAFYHKMFRLNSEKMIRKHIVQTAETLSGFFNVPVNYFYLEGNKIQKIAIPKIRFKPPSSNRA